jgi:hypothetical protein
MCLKALNVACLLINDIEDSDNEIITASFANRCLEIVNNMGADSFIIELDIIRRAKKLLDYFNMNKLILSSYMVDPYCSFDEAFDKICELRPRNEHLSPYFASLPAKTRRFMKRAFQIPHTKFNASVLSFNNLNVEEALHIFNQLEQLQLGNTFDDKAKNKMQVHYFKRCTSNDLIARPELGANILGMGLNLTEVIELLQQTEEADEKKRLEALLEENENSKRLSSSNSMDQCGSPKRRKLANNKKASKKTIIDKKHGFIPIRKEKITLSKGESVYDLESENENISNIFITPNDSSDSNNDKETDSEVQNLDHHNVSSNTNESLDDGAEELAKKSSNLPCYFN